MQRIDNAQIWEEIFTNKEWGKYPSISLVRFIASKFYKVRDQQQIRILEIGCGPGGNLWYMAREGFKVTGIDFSATARELLQDRFLRDGLTGQLEGFLIGNYQDELPKLEDEYFDAIVDVESLYCNSFEDSKEIIENCLRKVKKDGYLFSQTFTDTSWGFNSKEVYEQLAQNE
jgi:cyclopropane fatty-acyl-phospholipid synthase-like methyltransferase